MEQLGPTDIDARADAEWMLCKIMKCGRAALRFIHDIDDAAVREYDSMVARRLDGEPLQYILGDQPFMGYSIRCDARALIPRPETEEVCLEALDYIKTEKVASVLDLCTGTGAIAVAIKLKRPLAHVTATDISKDALSLARENASTLYADVEFIEGDLFNPLSGRSFDVIVSNPPYLSADDMAEITKEVRAEPSIALFGGKDGLDFYRRIAKEAPAHLNPGGICVLEIGATQGLQIERLFKERFNVSIKSDINGKPRTAVAVLK